MKVNKEKSAFLKFHREVICLLIEWWINDLSSVISLRPRQFTQQAKLLSANLVYFWFESSETSFFFIFLSSNFTSKIPSIILRFDNIIFISVIPIRLRTWYLWKFNKAIYMHFKPDKSFSFSLKS